MPETLIESELFGHEKGAFTGASVQRKGKFEAANGGSLFLDEIGDMSPSTQSKVLRALEERVFERLGGNKSIATDVRILSATHRDLQSEIRAGNFREDLYYRLCVVNLRVPPLRERDQDILLLAEHFSQRFSARHERRRDFEITAEAQFRLLEYAWPGNVRELKNVIERAVVLASEGPLDVKDLPEVLRQTTPIASRLSGDSSRFVGMKYVEAKSAFEREYFTAYLDAAGGNLTRAAEAMGVHRQTLQYRLRQLGIRKRWTD
jgi:transcriptional regulator with GAF, ATPase, and Fis domain